LILKIFQENKVEQDAAFLVGGGGGGEKSSTENGRGKNCFVFSAN
jgi:hypothetical protein